MELFQQLKHITDISGIPITYYVDGKICECTNDNKYLQHLILNTPKNLLNFDKHIHTFLANNILSYGYIQEQEKNNYFLIGPIAIINCDNNHAQYILKSFGLSTSETGQLLSYLQSAPVWSLQRFADLIIFLAFIINDEDIDTVDLLPSEYKIKQGNVLAAPKINTKGGMVHNAENYEKEIYAMVLHGEYEQMLRMSDRSPSFINEGTLAGDLIRHRKNLMICSTALAARYAVWGGVEYNEAMTLADAYIQKIELANSQNFLSEFHADMLLVYAKMVSDKKLNNPISIIATKARAYIQDHIFENITTQNIANELKISRPYLSTQFKKDTGLNLNTYITKLKIDEAEILLKTTELTAVEIAETLAFSSQSYFQSNFKKLTGITPREYRQQLSFIKQ